MPFTDDQIAHIKRIQDERGISYKSAVQYMRRLTKKTTIDIETIVDGKPAITIQEPGKPAVVIPVYTTQPNTPDVAAPVDQTETILSDVPTSAVVCDNLAHPSRAHKGDGNCYNAQPATLAQVLRANPGATVTATVAVPALPKTVGQAVAIALRKDAEANGDNWNVDRAVEMYKAGGKQIDIAEAMGYPRGKGQTRVRRALQDAGVWQGAH